MPTLFDQLRDAVEFEAAIAGPVVPLDREGRTADEPPREATIRPPGSKAEVESRPHVATDRQGAQPTETEGLPVGLAALHSRIPTDSPIRALANLDALKTWVAETELVPIDGTRTNPVFGVGRPDADLMVIGEAPGADEDRQGEPFVGRAGQLLTKILEAIGFAREDVYIANILKSRPPRNRDPLPAEVQAHIPVLYKQIILIRPKLILCVGKTAGNSLLECNDSLRNLRQTFHDFHGIPVVVTYHPAALLRNPQWKRPTWDDVRMLRDRYDSMLAQAP
jgi:DNA polymerase